MVLKRDDFESRLYPCVGTADFKGCGKLKVRKRLGARKTPHFCPDCLVRARKSQLKKARGEKGKDKEPEGIEIMAPDGFPIRLKDEEEKKFYESRKAEYLNEFDWDKSADLGLLSRLLSLEVSCRRYESRLKLKDTEARDRLNLIKEIRDTQEKLGILRLQRKRKKEERTPLDIVQNLIKRFNDYREKNPDRFVWLCSHCGKKNYLKRENPNLSQEKIDIKVVEESGATPIEENNLKPNDINEKTLHWQQREGAPEE